MPLDVRPDASEASLQLLLVHADRAAIDVLANDDPLCPDDEIVVRVVAILNSHSNFVFTIGDIDQEPARFAANAMILTPCTQAINKPCATQHASVLHPDSIGFERNYSGVICARMA